ncbi:peroxiredoxin (alkyl hydroperoxide reductase subunit C) [Syntrophus gentianae]|uniref:Peroxiredoxin (Alkyl hydroperoxide reductase subunit C) n=1 Tax=Syntrophus gentianae TaxID=43775 RepID=A0A1H7WRM1_9BACT|nr:peroxiredoxin (alkyl hydroperoxide reductase subunit C) [Syntrophus gentianae]
MSPYNGPLQHFQGHPWEVFLMAAILKKGDQAPDFILTNQFGKTIKLGDFKGRKLIVYFYPRSDTTS